MFAGVIVASIAIWARAWSIPNLRSPLQGPEPLKLSWIEFGLALWIILFAVWFAQMFAGQLLTSPNGDEAAKQPEWFTILVSLTLQLPLLAVPLILAKVSPWQFGPLGRGFTEKPLQAVKVAILALLKFMPLVWIVALGFAAILFALSYLYPGLRPTQQPLVEELQQLDSIFILLSLFVISVVVAPIAEEIFFRSLVFRFLLERIGLNWAIAISSFLFAIAHFHLTSLAPLLALGALMAYAYWKSGNLLVPIFIHAAFNFFSFANLILLRMN